MQLYKIPYNTKEYQYAKLILGYGVSTEIREMLIGKGMPTEKDFRKVTNRNHKVVCYQIYPENILEGFAWDNNIKVVDQLKGLNRTKELGGSVIEPGEFNKEREKLSMELEPLYIVNRKVYLLLHKNFPRMQFIPIFPK